MGGTGYRVDEGRVGAHHSGKITSRLTLIEKQPFLGQQDRLCTTSQSAHQLHS
jgi:hypothetical protein